MINATVLIYRLMLTGHRGNLMGTTVNMPVYPGRNIGNFGPDIVKETGDEKIIALAGNPNVGKSTVFNGLTGLKQHTGNWPGKTVAVAQGRYSWKGKDFILVDLPGTYSLSANSAEEEIARDFICFGGSDAVVVVVDATCLERNLTLVLQTIEITDKVVVCVNLMDEAEKKGITIDLESLQERLGVPVVGTSARNGRGLTTLMDVVKATADGIRAKIGIDGTGAAVGNDTISETISTNAKRLLSPIRVKYFDELEKAVSAVEPIISHYMCESNRINSRWIALRLLEGESGLLDSLCTWNGLSCEGKEKLSRAVSKELGYLDSLGISTAQIRDRVVTEIVRTCEKIYTGVVRLDKKEYAERDRKIDRFLTSKLTGIPVMIALLFVVFWITLWGANYPSKLLADGLFSLERPLADLIGAPDFIVRLFSEGVYRTVSWVVSVMLPPMAIFFPLFTLLEDCGYLPRIAFNLDNFFRKACAHGKQSLTMCLGLGCNAAGVIGCRIIDSPRERLIATITNNFVPCNGRFPTLIALITMFFAGVAGGVLQTAISTAMLTGVIVLGVAATVITSRVLSATVLKGTPSSFYLELPPYRRPQIGRVIVRSVMDRTLFVLGRAVAVAAPAGLLIWLLANIYIGETSLLAKCADFLQPFAHLMGLDGYILLAFILGFPANEIVVPIIIMSYTSQGALVEFESLAELRALFVENGWTWLTALCTMLFSLMHWPCSTTCLTIRKETQSAKWTLLSIAVPTLAGILMCISVAAIARLLGLAA